jgi:branched-chain amino acid transport system substrate-binding protein
VKTATHIAACIGIVAALVCVSGSLRAAEPYEIDVITSLTGQSALGGKQTADTLHVIEARVNAAGGIGGRPIHFTIEDDQTSPQVAVGLANAIIAKKVPVILGPQIAANCNAVAPLIADGPVLWCFSPAFHPPKGSYGFSSNASTGALIEDTVRYFHALGLNKIALIATTDATGQDGERNLDLAIAAPDMAGMSVVAREHFNVADVSVAAQMARIKASGAQALLAWVTLTPLATVLRGFSEAGLEIPVATVNANASAVQLKSYAGFMPKTLLIAAMLNQVPDQLPNGPVRRKVDEFYDAYKSTLGFAPEGSANLAWDATLIVIDALRKYGTNASASRIRDFIGGLHGWVGINGVYDFRDGSQRGLGPQNVLVMRWDPARGGFLAVSKPGGAPLK